MGKLKDKWNELCDKAEAKIEQHKKDAKEWKEKHPNLDRLCGQILMVGGFLGMIGLSVAASNAIYEADKRDREEHPEKYLPKEDTRDDMTKFLDLATKLDLTKGEKFYIEGRGDGDVDILHIDMGRNYGNEEPEEDSEE